MTTKSNTSYLKSSKDTFKQLQSFTSIEGMNKAVNHFKGQLLSPKLKNAKNVLQLVSEHSCVYFGVSFLSQKSIAEKLVISYKTVQRAIDKLVAIGAVIRRASKRETGDRRQSSNILIIQPIPQATEVASSESNSLSDQPEVSNQEAKSINQNIKNTSDTEKSDFEKKEAIKKGLVIKLPKTLQQSLAPFFDADKLYELSGIVFKAKSSVDKNIRIEDHEDEYYNAILSVINAFKRGKVRNFEGLLCHAVKAVTRSIWIKDRFSSAVGI